MVVSVLNAEHIFFPTAFSPNGDGVNDLFQIFYGPEVLEILELQIFDRWGNLLFGSSQTVQGLDLAWDGTFRGQALPPGVYGYSAVVLFINGEKKIYSGGFDLLR